MRGHEWTLFKPVHAGRAALAVSVIAAGMLATLPGAQAQDRLNVALYPYVPRLDQFETAIRDAWAEVEPNVTLTFATSEEWDGGYDIDPSADFDVYVFDAMFFEYFRTSGWMEPIAESEIDDPDDLLSYARDGVMVDGTYYAIPLLGCANILFYDKDDTVLANATTLSEITDALGQCTYTSEIPPDVRGLMTDMSGGTTNAAFYLDATHDLNGIYPPPLPATPSDLNETSIDNLRQVMAIASYWNATASTESYQRAAWLSDGWGRALIGFTEAMSNMDAETRSNIGFKVMPLSDNESERPIFYSDVIAVNTTTVDRGTRDLAVKLANLMGSTDVMVASTGSNDTYDTPQFLMPTRTSVFEALSQVDPIYADMHNLVLTDNPRLFSLDADVKTWLTTMKEPITADIRADYTCACDFPAMQSIPDTASAAPICTATCSDYGGWNGQWTNASPAAQDGSVCGCNTCPVPSAG